MFFFEGQCCPICGQHFAETDDIVVCPECGAPHHRACWRAEGHCHFEEDHGTERQWAKTDPEPPTPKRRCPHCGADNPEFAEFCGHCGRDIDTEPTAQQTPPVNRYTPHGAVPPPAFYTVDPFGGVPRSEQIDGVPVEILARVIGPNSAYYLPKIKQMSETGRKVFWSFPAFLIPYNWLLYRKNLLVGWLTFVFYTVINFFFQHAFDRLFPGTTLPSAAEMMELAMSSGGSLLWTAMSIASTVIILIHVLFGLFGNWIYMQHVMKKARQLMENPTPYEEQRFPATGGVSPAMGVLPEFILVFLNYIVSVITLL